MLLAGFSPAVSIWVFQKMLLRLQVVLAISIPVKTLTLHLEYGTKDLSHVFFQRPKSIISEELIGRSFTFK